MAHKSKTQRAKAAAAKANKKDRELRDKAAGKLDTPKKEDQKADNAVASTKRDVSKQQDKGADVKKAKKKKSSKFQFFYDVKAELKRVTWPDKTDVLRWSGVVVGALVFFGVYVAVFDNLIITPGLIALSGLGA